MKIKGLLIAFTITTSVIIVSCKNTVENNNFSDNTEISNTENFTDKNETRVIQKKMCLRLIKNFK